MPGRSPLQVPTLHVPGRAWLVFLELIRLPSLTGPAWWGHLSPWTPVLSQTTGRCLTRYVFEDFRRMGEHVLDEFLTSSTTTTIKFSLPEAFTAHMYMCPCTHMCAQHTQSKGEGWQPTMLEESFNPHIKTHPRLGPAYFLRMSVVSSHMLCACALLYSFM